ncbi:MAG: hypothetical protein WDZ51_01785 [Pirellulaceae bacterium]
MLVQRLMMVAIACVAWVSLGQCLEAAPPWSKIIPFQRIDANPSDQYELVDTNGPWMVMAYSFTGPGAQKDAHNLVLELRKDFSMQAFVFHQDYDYTETVQGRGYDRYGEPKKMKYARGVSETSYAVLVGNFESYEDSGLQTTLKKIKTIHPKSLNNGYSTTNDSVKTMRQRLRETIGISEEDKHLGPMGNAFVSRNPLLPEEYFRPQGLDPLLVEMNQGGEYSLLKCPGKISVRVATFRGAIEIDQKKIKEIERNNKGTGERLAKAGEQAEKLARALRKQGVEAYVFHDRFESIVTVGSFPSVGTERRDGSLEMNPQLARVIQTYSGSLETGAGASSATYNGLPAFKAKMVAGIPFDVQPIPVEVPEVSLASNYTRPAGLQ